MKTWISLFVAGLFMYYLGMYMGRRSARPKPPTLVKDLITQSINEGRCPDCGNKEFFQGPSAGLCTNIKCTNPECGSMFNVCKTGFRADEGDLIFVERI